MFLVHFIDNTMIGREKCRPCLCTPSWRVGGCLGAGALFVCSVISVVILFKQVYLSHLFVCVLSSLHATGAPSPFTLLSLASWGAAGLGLQPLSASLGYYRLPHPFVYKKFEWPSGRQSLPWKSLA